MSLQLHKSEATTQILKHTFSSRTVVHCTAFPGGWLGNLRLPAFDPYLYQQDPDQRSRHAYEQRCLDTVQCMQEDTRCPVLFPVKLARFLGRRSQEAYSSVRLLWLEVWQWIGEDNRRRKMMKSGGGSCWQDQSPKSLLIQGKSPTKEITRFQDDGLGGLSKAGNTIVHISATELSEIHG